MLKTYLKTGWRNLLKNKTISIINITGLSVGMAAAMFILLWVQNELSFDNYHPASKRICQITFSDKEGSNKWDGSPLLLADAAKQKIPGIEKATKFLTANRDNPVLNINNEFYKEKNAVFVDSNWFSFFHYDYVEGNANAFNQNPNSIILTESLAKKYYGKKEAVGRTIIIDSINYKVQAVIKDNPSNSSFQFNIFFPLQTHLPDAEAIKNESSWNSFTWITFVQLNPNIPIKQVLNQLAQLLKTERNNEETFVSLIALKNIHFETSFGDLKMLRQDKKVVFIFAILGSLLLLIACINYINLSTARASLRAKEVSIKKIIGASGKTLFKQFIAESFLTSFIALIITLLIIQIALPLFNSFTEKHFIFSLSSINIWIVLAGTFVTTIILTSIYPALLLSSFKPLNMLKGLNVLKVKNTALRKTLVISQFTIAIALMISTIVIFKQLSFIRKQNKGYNSSQVFSVPLPREWFNKHKEANKEQMFNTFKQQLVANTSIENATITSGSVINIMMAMSGVVDWEGKAPGLDPMVSVMSVDEDFRKIFQLQLTEGRWFQPDNIQDKHNYILNETAIATFGLQPPYIGKRLIFANDTGHIIGIIEDFHYRSLHEKVGSIILINNQLQGTMFIKTAAAKTPQALQATETIWKKLFPQEPFEYDFLDEAFAQLYRSDIKTSTLTGLFSCIAIIISCLGLFGLAAFTAEQRIKEIGIRKVLGATVTNITALLSRDFIKLVVIAFVIASPLAWLAMNKWLENFVYRININWLVFVLAGLAAVFIALLTVSFQAIKAAIANPVKSLRTE